MNIIIAAWKPHGRHRSHRSNVGFTHFGIWKRVLHDIMLIGAIRLPRQAGDVTVQCDSSIHYAR